MPIKIILYAKDMAQGTEVVADAMARGAALAEFITARPPILKEKKKPGVKSKAEKKKRKIIRTPASATYDFDDSIEHTAPIESPRTKAYDALESNQIPMTRQEMLTLVCAHADIPENQAKSAFGFFKKHGIIKLTPTLRDKVDDVIADLGTSQAA